VENCFANKPFLLPTLRVVSYLSGVESERSALTQADAESASGAQISTVAWFCLRSQPRHEHIAARHLRQMEDVEVFNPCIRFARPTRRGPLWMTESLFPNYLFARFDWATSLPKVHYAPSVSGVVHFGTQWPCIPDQAIQELRARLGPNEMHEISKEFEPGEQIKVAGGLFHGLTAVITQLMPGRDRVLILMDFLGRQTTVEVPVSSIVKCVSR
jgi:transcriptional antiterminator RfaH